MDIFEISRNLYLEPLTSQLMLPHSMPLAWAGLITFVGQGVAPHNGARAAVACAKLPKIAAVVDQRKAYQVINQVRIDGLLLQ